MTNQRPDWIEYRRQTWDIAGATPVQPFSVYEHGIATQFISTACWKGYSYLLKIDNNKLILSNFTVSLAEEMLSPEGLPPDILGVAPVSNDIFIDRIIIFGFQIWKGRRCKNPFETLFTYFPSMALSFTGGLLLGREPCLSWSGTPRAYHFKQVIEIIFDNGVIVRHHDHSKCMENFRQIDLEWYYTSVDKDHDNRDKIRSYRHAIHEAFNKCFDMTYKF
jgi:hypothetical protein